MTLLQTATPGDGRYDSERSYPTLAQQRGGTWGTRPLLNNRPSV